LFLIYNDGCLYLYMLKFIQLLAGGCLGLR